jgi:hypothetical protein
VPLAKGRPLSRLAVPPASKIRRPSIGKALARARGWPSRPMVRKVEPASSKRKPNTSAVAKAPLFPPAKTTSRSVTAAATRSLGRVGPRGVRVSEPKGSKRSQAKDGLSAAVEVSQPW